MDGISDLIKETLERAFILSIIQGYSEEMTTYNLEEGTHKNSNI